MSANVEKVLAEIGALPPDEQRQVQARLAEILPVSAPAMTEEEFEQSLLADGVISSIPSRRLDSAEYHRRKPIEVKGKPVSETIIEERR